MVQTKPRCFWRRGNVMNTINWKTFTVGLLAGLAIGIAVGILMFSERQPHFVIVKTVGPIALKMDTRTGQTWQLISSRTGVTETESQHSVLSRTQDPGFVPVAPGSGFIPDPPVYQTKPKPGTIIPGVAPIK
jgi:hypothetical protein